MGNSASNANNPPGGRSSNQPQPQPIRTTSTSPGPGKPHPSMRTKKRSLELPDLASLNLTPANVQGRGRQSKTASIPIPPTPLNPFHHYEQAQEVQHERAPVQLPSNSEFFEGSTAQGYLHPPSTHQPFPPHSRGRQAYQQHNHNHTHSNYNHSAPRGRQQGMSARQQQQVAHIQQLYDHSRHPPAPPSSPAGPSAMPGMAGRGGFVREVVKSSIPTLLGKKALLDAGSDGEVASPVRDNDLLADPVPVKIVWKGGGSEVVLARAGDDEWKGRQPMERDPVNTNVWTLTVHLLPGTHHVRFLVDGQWRVADDLPAAVDDQGSLANYVAVPLTYGVPGQKPPLQIAPPPLPPSALPTPRRVIPGQSFWSADSSADGEEGEPSGSSNVGTSAGASTAATSPQSHPSQSPGGQPRTSTDTATKQQAAKDAYVAAKWTNVFPPELLEAAREEEAYLAASAGQYDGQSGNTTRVMGFVPTPNIPPAPGLPRHLDKLILNSRVGEQKAGGGSAAGSASGRERGDRDHGGHGHSHSGSGVGSGQASSRRERRERGERERERERPRRRPNVPPPPPPSESGDGPGELDPPLPSPVVQEEHPQAGPSTSAAGPSGSASAGSGLSSTTTATETGGTTTAATSPQVSVPATPTGQMSPTQSPPKSVTSQVNGNGAASSSASPPQASASSSSQPLSSSTSSQLPSSSSHPPSSSLSASLSPSGSSPYPHPHPPHLDRAPISGSRMITIDTDNMPALTDDGSVLPVPSHVVLHHLCTSAIKNGVLAVANTTRYRKKYLTTIYYKPT